MTLINEVVATAVGSAGLYGSDTENAADQIDEA